MSTDAHGVVVPRRRRMPIASGSLLSLAVVVGILLVLEALTRGGVLSSDNFPPPSVVGEALVDELGMSVFWQRVLETLEAWVVGFGIALVLGVPLGLVIGSTEVVRRSVRLIIEVLRPIPPVAVLPLAVLLYGTGTRMIIYLVAFSAFWPILFQTIYGVQDVDPVARETVRAYGLRRVAQFRHVVVPSAMPYIATGVRLAATIALVVVIATELIVGSSGLGFEINQVRYAGDVPAMYALVVVAGLLGWLIAVLVRVGERRVLRWHPSQRKERDTA